MAKKEPGLQEMHTDEHFDRIARHIPPGSRVLELGVATGYFSRFLSGKLNCLVDGVEINPVMAARAEPDLNRLVTADLETLDLKESFPQQLYDRIILADILEHLKAPAFVLKQLPALLKEDGQIIISIPNAAYAGLILELLGGGFNYRSEGILDRTHLRFYTQSSFRALLEELGFTVISAEPVKLPLSRSEFFPTLDQIAVPFTRFLTARPEATAYQYVFTAVTGRKTDHSIG